MEGVIRDVSFAWPAERTVKARMRALRRERVDGSDIWGGILWDWVGWVL